MYRINYTQVAPTLIKHLDLSMQTVLSIDTLSIRKTSTFFLQKKRRDIHTNPRRMA